MKECKFFDKHPNAKAPVCTEGNATSFCPHGKSRYGRKHCPYSIWEEVNAVEPAFDQIHGSGQDPLEEKS
jgi:hypothetical protein